MRIMSSPGFINRAWHSAACITMAITLVFALSSLYSIPVRAEDKREVISKVKPVYPELARRMKITGAVLLTATVGPSGRVTKVNPVMGENLLLKAAREAVIQWKFAPAEYETVEDVEVVFP